jgi:hypothetical protein
LILQEDVATLEGRHKDRRLGSYFSKLWQRWKKQNSDIFVTEKNRKVERLKETIEGTT